MNVHNFFNSNLATTTSTTTTLKGMSHEQQNRPILSADKIARQKSVVCHAKIAWFCRPTKSPDFVSQDRACSIFDDFVSQLFVYRTANFVYVAMMIVYNGRWVFILVIYCVCYYFRSLDAEKMMQVLFCDLCSTVVLADNVRSSRQNYRPCHGSPILSADLVGQLNHAHKSRPTLSFVWHPLNSNYY